MSHEKSSSEEKEITSNDVSQNQSTSSKTELTSPEKTDTSKEVTQDDSLYNSDSSENKEAQKQEEGELLAESMVEEKKPTDSELEGKPMVADSIQEKIENNKEDAPETNDEDIETDDADEGIESSEDEDNEDEEDRSQKDYSNLSKKELIKELDSLLKNSKIQDIKHDVEEIRSEFINKFNEELEQKKEEFLAEGGNIIDFKYTTPLRKEFNNLLFGYKEKRNNYYNNLKRNLQDNLNKRWELIEELKNLLSAEENINTTYKHFKEIQEKWHLAGPIPRDKYNTVWNTYHHHVENFYDFLHLNREFRDLDFKHNLDAKLKLITRAEELAQEKDINKAFRELQLLHKMWKEEIGPVAKEYRDEVWDKFSDATKVIHDKRQEQMAIIEKEFEENYEKKKQIIEQINELIQNVKPTHHGWQGAIKAIQELRDSFFETGRVPKAHNKEIWKAFKEATGNFNKQKNSFYKNQKKEQFANLEKKRELIKIAEDNMNSEDFETTTELMKKIQEDWKKVGHVPRKDSDKVWKQFKKACNHYFDRLHAEKNEANKEEKANYEAKQAMLDSMGEFEFTGNHNEDVKKIKQLISSWKKIGRVPYNKRFVEQKFNKALDGLFSKLDLDKKESELIKFDNKLNTLVNRDDEKKLQNEHFFISKKIDETRDEIRQLENNLGFFHNVDENNPMVREVHKNIARHKEQLEVWKAKLSKIKEIRE